LTAKLPCRYGLAGQEQAGDLTQFNDPWGVLADYELEAIFDSCMFFAVNGNWFLTACHCCHIVEVLGFLDVAHAKPAWVCFACCVAGLIPAGDQ
jgi:hypothetical protein